MDGVSHYRASHAWADRFCRRSVNGCLAAGSTKALAWYFDHPDDIDAELAAEYHHVERWRQAHPTPSFLARLKAKQAR